MTFPRRFLEGLWLCGLISLGYYGIGYRIPTVREPIVTVIDQAIPFVPWTFWFYMPGYLSCLILAIWAIRTRVLFRAAWRSFLVVTLLALPFFILWPVASPRPPAPDGTGLTAAGIRWLFGSDPTGNTFPSLHIANSVLSAWIAWQVERRVGAIAALLALGVVISVLTLKQHWFIDIPGGIFLAVLGGVAWRRQVAVLSERWADEYPTAAPIAIGLPRWGDVLSRWPRRRRG
jgi:membrane-associated phospholipid phosphatase